jgi:hypothetical protein
MRSKGGGRGNAEVTTGCGEEVGVLGAAGEGVGLGSGEMREIALRNEGLDGDFLADVRCRGRI